MTIDLYIAFLVATVMLILIPGPNVAVIVGNTVRHGTRAGLYTVAGTLFAQAIQLAVTVLGMTAILVLLSHWFEWLRWAGVAYLVFAGWQQWNAPPVEGPQAQTAVSTRELLRQGFVVSLTNPKTMLFHAAFLPQFIDPAAAPAPQLTLLACTFIVVSSCLDSVWAILAGRLRQVFNGRGRLLNRVSGGLFMGAGLGLALIRRN